MCRWEGTGAGRRAACVNVFLTMLLGGLWHGAAWNFVLWGIWQGGGVVLQRLVRPDGKAPSEFRTPHSALRTSLSWLGTMLFVLYGWLLFRAGSQEKVAAMTRGLGNFLAAALVRQLRGEPGGVHRAGGAAGTVATPGQPTDGASLVPMAESYGARSVVAGGYSLLGERPDAVYLFPILARCEATTAIFIGVTSCGWRRRHWCRWQYLRR